VNESDRLSADVNKPEIKCCETILPQQPHPNSHAAIDKSGNADRRQSPQRNTDQEEACGAPDVDGKPCCVDVSDCKQQGREVAYLVSCQTCHLSVDHWHSSLVGPTVFIDHCILHFLLVLYTLGCHCEGSPSSVQVLLGREDSYR
jgi:hypothetical protein